MPSAKTKTPSLELQDRDLAILCGLFESRLMRLDHITSLYFDGRGEAAKKRIQKLKSEGLIAERSRRAYEPSILYLTRQAFAVLSKHGKLIDYPQLSWHQLEDRARVSDLTLRHELAVLDVKTALSCGMRRHSRFTVVEFSTWPLLYQFMAAQPPPPGYGQSRPVTIKPDGFMRIHEEVAEELAEHFFFLEVDRSTEPRQTLTARAFGYQDFYRKGGLAVRYGGSSADYKEFPFRVLMVFPNAERRNNIAERLITNNPPILGLVWLTTITELTNAPMGEIWIRPQDYRTVSAGTQYDAARPTRAVYRRQPDRESFIEAHIQKHALFDDG